jgi:hypothetical protein
VEAKAGMTCVTGSAIFSGRLSCFGRSSASDSPFTFDMGDMEIWENIVGEALYLDLRCEIADSFVVIGLGFLISGLCWGCSQIPDPPVNPERPKHREKFSIHVA